MWAVAKTAKDGAGALRRANFELRNELTVNIPEGAKKVRVWFALPQDEDAAQKVSGLRIEAPYPHRVERDSEGSKVLYLEAQNPKQKDFKVVTTFNVERSEVRTSVDPAKAKPLTDADRARYAKYCSRTSTSRSMTKSARSPTRLSVTRPTRSSRPGNSTTGC